ncbi:unnamed protein product [Schistocephalus solidus]|uniref:Reverse transcriptase domain-containing protein n=1 Tax=Schistocephalus solidus TaxID=70667 RepID=A0A183TAW3_SCHSO|nr:unnamed protein product [Schistocephalus solidus]
MLSNFTGSDADNCNVTRIPVYLADNPAGISMRNMVHYCQASHLDQGLLPESQCGFRRHRGTTDMIFTCQLQEKFQEMRTHLYTTFVDLNGHLKQGLLPESQCGFRRHRGTTDMIFAARSRKANVASADTAEQPI